MAEPRPVVRTWTLLDELVLEVYLLTGRFPEEERQGLARTLRDAVVAAAVALLRGTGRGETELKEAALQALGSLGPLRYHFYLARRLNLMEVRRYRMICLRHDRACSALRELAGIAASPQPPAARASSS